MRNPENSKRQAVVHSCGFEKIQNNTFDVYEPKVKRKELARC